MLICGKWLTKFMIQKYLKSILITLGIIILAWGNTYTLYANKKRVEALVSQVSELGQQLEDSRQKEVETTELLKEAEENLKNLISKKQEEARLLAVAVAKPKAAPVVIKPAPKPVTVSPIVEKPAVVKVIKPSRSTRAS